jgi:signal transduction histidine kinase
MTSSSISEIIEYENLIGNVTDELLNLETTTKETLEIINNKSVTQLSLPKLANNFTSIRNNIKTIRNIIYARFSSKPTEVINNLVINFESILEEKNISISKRKRYPQEIPVLIKGYELANILDNLFQNSIRFLKDSTNKNISIELYKESPKIIIKFSNNGSSIDKEKWEVIFEHGYSEGGSTGQGLFNAREILKKYGGRMYVDVSNSEITTFKIELNEGIILS